MRQVRSHLGAAVYEDTKDLSEVQKPLLEHAKDKGKPEESVNQTRFVILPGNWVNRNGPISAKFPERKPWLLDLFCCAGGAGMGYSQAGFRVIGVDIDPQPSYPFPFIRHDALTLDSKFMALFDAIHASPPCQSYSDLAKRNGNGDSWPRLIEPVRELLASTGLPSVIENVQGAPMRDPVILCGTMFEGLRVIRHRLFEANFPIVAPSHGMHPLVHTFDKRKKHYGMTDERKDFVQVTGGGNCTIAAASQAMGITWMTKKEINEAIPPAYTKFIGEQLLAYLWATEVEPTVGQRVNA